MPVCGLPGRLPGDRFSLDATHSRHRHEKACIRDFRPDCTQTGLRDYIDLIAVQMFRLRR